MPLVALAVSFAERNKLPTRVMRPGHVCDTVLLVSKRHAITMARSELPARDRLAVGSPVFAVRDPRAHRAVCVEEHTAAVGCLSLNCDSLG